MNITSQSKTNASGKPWDLEERMFLFAQRVRRFLRRVPRTIANQEYGRQLIRASGSVGANYIEACECLGKKDHQMHLKISRKEARESRHWLRLIDTGGEKDVEDERQELIQEATELVSILSSILHKSKKAKEVV
ncbi:MAG: four helix bundle protein [Phycisphaerae bacterium]|nr:four helix bundle protein [Phycisphaerae bacterium]